MRKENWINAVVASSTFFVLALFMMGLQLALDGTKLIVTVGDSVRWNWIIAGIVVIFVYQLVRPTLSKVWQGVPKKAWAIPDFDGSTTKQKILAVIIIIAAIIWPFIVSRGSVDIATLTLIYVMLGLGLNVVVGLSGLLVLGYAGFYAIGAYTLVY